MQDKGDFQSHPAEAPVLVPKGERWNAELLTGSAGHPSGHRYCSLGLLPGMGPLHLCLEEDLPRAYCCDELIVFTGVLSYLCFRWLFFQGWGTGRNHQQFSLFTPWGKVHLQNM